VLPCYQSWCGKDLGGGGGGGVVERSGEDIFGKKHSLWTEIICRHSAIGNFLKRNLCHILFH
jgi:hypothetical protein